MIKNHRKTGTLYEQYAGKFLEEKGYQIVRYNYRCKAGEVDIIARDGSYLVFCEVKYRRDRVKGEPAEAVTAAKQKRISRCAMFYTTQRGLKNVPIRFDVVAVTGGAPGDNTTETIELIKNAFDYTE